MEDPSAQAIARVYADAFLTAASGAGVADALGEFASFIDDVVRANPQFDAIFTSGLLSRDEKLGIIDRVIASVVGVSANQAATLGPTNQTTGSTKTTP